MHKITKSIFILAGFMFSLLGAQQELSRPSPTIPPITPRPPPFGRPQQPARTPAPQTIPRVQIPQTPPEPPAPIRITFFRPGLAVLRGGEWTGGVNLYNLTNQIQIFIEIVKAPELQLPFNESTIRSEVERAFQSVGITPLPEKPDSPLPFFHIQILIQKIPNGYALAINEGLFESGTVDRNKNVPGATWQLISWENSSLIIATDQDVVQTLMSYINESIEEFTKNYSSYQHIKQEMRQEPERYY